MKKFSPKDYVGIVKAVVVVAKPQDETIASFLAKIALETLVKETSKNRFWKLLKIPGLSYFPLAEIIYQLCKEGFKIQKSVEKLVKYKYDHITSYLEPRFCDAALLAMHVYPNKYCRLPRGWEVSQSCNSIFNRQKDISVQLYFNKNEKHYAMAFAGTVMTNVEDWQANIYQLKGISNQYNTALSLAKEVANYVRTQNAKLSFIGHSKGGGMATLCAMALNRDAIVFNPAGVSESTYKKCDVEFNMQKTNNIVSIIVYNDLLSLIQETAHELSYSIVPQCKTPIAIGRKIYVDTHCDGFWDSHDIGKMNVSFQNKRLS